MYSINESKEELHHTSNHQMIRTETLLGTAARYSGSELAHSAYHRPQPGPSMPYIHLDSHALPLLLEEAWHIPRARPARTWHLWLFTAVVDGRHCFLGQLLIGKARNALQPRRMIRRSGYVICQLFLTASGAMAKNLRNAGVNMNPWLVPTFIRGIEFADLCELALGWLELGVGQLGARKDAFVVLYRSKTAGTP
jgi:hypothetical protein